MKTSTTFSFLASLVAVSAAGCPAPGTTNAAGEVSCDPALVYPGQACALINGCNYLRGLGLLTGSAPATPTVTSTATSTPTTATCPPPGQTNAAGDYSCNPAHEYPEEVCVLINGCYFLRGLGLLTSTTSAPAPHPTCPPAGACNAAGDTSCNPAVQYPGQACVLMNGCYFLRGLNGNVTFTVPPPASTTGGHKPTSLVPATSKGAAVTTSKSQPTTVVTGGASHLSAFGGLAVIGLVAALL